MSKKFTKTILSSAVAGLMLVSSGAMAAEPEVINVGDGTQYQIKIFNNGASAEIYDVKNKSQLMGAINTVTGKVTTVNKKEVGAAIKAFEASLSKEQKELYDKSVDLKKATLVQAGYTYRYSIDVPLLKADKLNSITVDDVNNIKSNFDKVSTVITSKTAADYNQAISNGMSSEAALTVAGDTGGAAVLQEFNRINSKIVTDTTFAIDADGNITLDETDSVEREPVKNVVAGIQADTTIHKNDDGSYTMDPWTKDTARVNEAVVDLDTRTRSNTKAIQSNSRQLQEHNARLN
ncbi:hypothetical protein HQI60_02220, partial [Escherichia coli]|nr:hypothetical protein [Escherichia coli]